ncbi:STAS domain-containing protein [Nonomuraea sp. NPDC050783]|uniref:STAS domain-containing protein n=1 Tax=Nonomuraea sp. NPDC050783 TaxID=3154634 RepID=UPI00346669BF
MTAFAVEVVRRAGYWLMTLRGELDRQTQPELWRTLRELLEAAARPHIVCDLSNLSFCDSSGLRALLIAHQQAQERGGGLRLIRASANLTTLLEITRLVEVLPAYDDLDHATSGLSHPE